jgi:hypothetical protein
MVPGVRMNIPTAALAANKLMEILRLRSDHAYKIKAQSGLQQITLCKAICENGAIYLRSKSLTFNSTFRPDETFGFLITGRGVVR